MDFVLNILLGVALFESAFATALPVKSNSDVIFCLLSYQGLIIDRTLLC